MADDSQGRFPATSILIVTLIEDASQHYDAVRQQNGFVYVVGRYAQLFDYDSKEEQILRIDDEVEDDPGEHA